MIDDFLIEIQADELLFEDKWAEIFEDEWV